MELLTSHAGTICDSESLNSKLIIWKIFQMISWDCYNLWWQTGPVRTSPSSRSMAGRSSWTTRWPEKYEIFLNQFIEIFSPPVPRDPGPEPPAKIEPDAASHPTRSRVEHSHRSRYCALIGWIMMLLLHHDLTNQSTVVCWISTNESATLCPC